MQLSYSIVSYDSVRIIFICRNQEIQYIQYVRPNLKKKNVQRSSPLIGKTSPRQQLCRTISIPNHKKTWSYITHQ